MAYPIKLIQVILYLTSVCHLIYCRTIQRDLNTFAKISKRTLDCDEEMDISEFNEIFINLKVSSNGHYDIDISDETVR